MNYRISIIGSGYLGQQIGIGFSSIGREVIYYDIVKKELDHFTMNIQDAIDKSEVSFICVPTPSTKTGIDLSYILDAVNKVAVAIDKKGMYHVVVIKSTVTPGTTENVIIPILRRSITRKLPRDFGVCVNPDFMTENGNCTDKRTFFNQERIVIGTNDEEAYDILDSLYSPLGISIYNVDIKVAEMVKYAANCALATKISYLNEIYNICEELGIDGTMVSELACLDKRIGIYGSESGKAFGGKCLPKDLTALIEFSKGIRYKPRLLEAVNSINNSIRRKSGVLE